MALFAWEGQKTNEYDALIDVRSGSVGVGIIESNKKYSTPTLIYSKRVPIRTPDADDKKTSLGALKNALLQAHTYIAKEGKQTLAKHTPGTEIKTLLAVCSSPWSHTISKETSFTREEPFEMTAKLHKELGKETKNATADEITKLETVQGFKFQATERVTIGARVNDYPVVNPIGLRGKSLRFVHVTNFVPQPISRILEEIQRETFPDADMRTYTYLFAAYCAMQSIRAETGSYWFVDVTGEATEIGIIEDGALVGSAFAAHGHETLVRNICNAQNAPREDAVTQLRAYTDGTLPLKDQEHLLPHLEMYRQTLLDTAEVLAKDYFAPNFVTATIPETMGAVFSRQITDVFTGLTREKPFIRVLTAKDATQFANQTSDVHLAVVGYVLHTLKREGHC